MRDAPFDEAAYLSANPDVAAAVAAGAFKSGSEHYRRFGRGEGRSFGAGGRPAPLSFPFPDGSHPSRRDKTLANIDPHVCKVLEIGALAAPMVSRGEGEVIYVDFAETVALRETYRNDPNVRVEDIVSVDAIWGQNTLQGAIGEGVKVDHVIASHVIEHAPDLVAWLDEIHEVLQGSGSLRLAVPDRRFTFDYLRAESTIADVVDAHLRQARAPTARQILDFHCLAAQVDCAQAWAGALEPSRLTPMSSLEQGLSLARESLATGTYYDTHCWVFTPLSFARLCSQMAQVGLLKFRCECFFATERNELEFFVHMRPSLDQQANVASWDEAASRVLT